MNSDCAIEIIDKIIKDELKILKKNFNKEIREEVFITRDIFNYFKNKYKLSLEEELGPNEKKDNYINFNIIQVVNYSNLLNKIIYLSDKEKHFIEKKKYKEIICDLHDKKRQNLNNFILLDIY